MYTIVGSGFGLYGYLPALAKGQDESVLLPRTYESKVRARPELAGTLPSIHWVEDEVAALSLASAVVIATPPKRQFEVVSRCLTLTNIEKLVLEKPLAASPAYAVELISKLREAKKRYRIGYTLLYTAWHQRLAWAKLSPSSAMLSINWTFMAHHFKRDLATWKRAHEEGGGVLRFYGIHLVALLVHHGYDGVLSSVLDGEDSCEPECWRAVFTGCGLPDCSVYVDSRSSTNRFEIVRHAVMQEEVMHGVADPFENEVHEVGEDARVCVLKRLLDTFQLDDRPFELFYERVNMLWQKIESV